MNWFLLILILKLFTTNWSAPIDLVENREEFQQDLDNLINKGFSVADEANNLIQTSKALVNGTVNAFNSSAVNESLNENLHKVEEDLHKFSSELQKELQKDSSQDAIEVSFEQKPNEEEVSAQVTEISSFDGAVNNEGVPLSTEHVGEILANSESRTNSLNLAETSETVQDLNQSQYSIDNSQQESSSTEQQSFQYPSSTSINDAQEDSVPQTNEERAEEVSSTTTSTEHQNEQLSNSSTEDITQQAATEGSPNLEYSENAKDSSDLKETVDNLANDLLNIASMVQTSTESSNAGEANENLNVSETFPKEHSERTPSFREAVDSFIEDIVEFGSKLGLATEQTSEQPSIANQDSQNVEEVQTTSGNPIESSTEQHEQNTEYPLHNTNTDDSQQLTLDTQPISNPEANGEESSTETPALKETVDSFINQVANIGSSLEETAKEIIDNAVMIKPEADNSSNSVLNNETNTNLEHSESQNPEETHEKVPTFKDAVDAFIEDVVEIGSKLGLVPEQKLAEEAVPETTVQENKTAESTAASDLNLSNSHVELTTDKAEEFPPTTLSPMEALNENQQENIPKADENTEYSNFGRSADTLIQAASEIGIGFSEAVSNLFSLSDNAQVTVTEIPNETATDIATPEEQTKTNDSETSSTTSPIENNVEISSTTESLAQNLDNKQETANVLETENSNDQTESPEEAKPKEEVKSAQFVEYIPVAVITIPEEELVPQRSAIAPQNETDQLNGETKSTEEEHQMNNETQSTEDEATANAQEQKHESQSTPESQQLEELTTTPSSTEAETTSSESPKSEEQTTSSPITPETTTQAHAAVKEETTNGFNKFENTLKTLIEQEKLKQQEKHLSTLETSHQETTTLTPNSQTFTTAKEESNTLVPQDETTMLPKKFEEELQMAVKALEETTHHHFEEFQNNLKEAFKKFTVWGAEHERQGEATTNKNNIEETTQNSTEQPTTTKTEEDSASTTEKVVETPLAEEEEPHRIGAINQNFVDRFSDNYQENTQMSATEEQKKEEESTLASEAESEQTTEITFTLTTTMSPVEDEEDGKGTQEQVGVTDSAEHSTTQNGIEENQTPTAESIVKGSTEAAAETTESIPETTIMPILARVPLHKDITSISLTTAEESATETLTHNEAATQPLETEQLKETHTELTQTQTAQPTEREQETITLSSPASNPQEMVTFIEHHEDTTTVRHADEEAEEETTKEIEEENTAKSQTQEPLTQAAFMEEQQQQIESTTEHEAQTQTAAASGQTTATIANIEDDTMTTQEQLAQQQTTETEIFSTTVVEKEEDATTDAAITSTAATAAVEPEPRSLSLPPPKLEYLQNEDGVEIFYGYSIVKHN